MSLFVDMLKTPMAWVEISVLAIIWISKITCESALKRCQQQIGHAVVARRDQERRATWLNIGIRHPQVPPPLPWKDINVR